MTVQWSRDVACPTCKARVGEPCRALTSRRATDTHTARAAAFYDAKRTVERDDSHA